MENTADSKLNNNPGVSSVPAAESAAERAPGSLKISDIIKDGKLHVSFEVFPPKTTTAIESVHTAVSEIAELRPSFISVTYGAGGGTSEFTLSLAEDILNKYQVPTLAHLTCVSSSRETITQRIEELKQAGIHNVMALRGDIPKNLEDADRSSWDYQYAIQLIRELKESGGDFCIGGACYPEKHTESPDIITDIHHLREKVEAGCDFLTTQMFFDNNLLYRYLYRIREAGITVPILPGIMPITSASQIDRAVRLSGSFIPTRFRSLVDRFGSSPAAMKRAGVLYAVDQIIDLFANGVTNVHVYTMNNPDVARSIMSLLSDIL